jgi:hypothetical protein
MTLTNKLMDYKRFFMAAANHDVPRLQSLISTAVQSGAGINAITRKIESTFAGLYIPKSFSQAEMDLAQLVLRLGGRQLLYALSHSLGLPSLCMIYNHMNLTRITPTIGPITIAGISNITECIIKPRQEVVPPLRLAALVLLWTRQKLNSGRCFSRTSTLLVGFAIFI